MWFLVPSELLHDLNIKKDRFTAHAASTGCERNSTLPRELPEMPGCAGTRLNVMHCINEEGLDRGCAQYVGTEESNGCSRSEARLW
jgi:hypothetical protein